ncbi:MAG: hypothetical protein Q9192_005555 [Flavoplaca navasiana]
MKCPANGKTKAATAQGGFGERKVDELKEHEKISNIESEISEIKSKQEEAGTAQDGNANSDTATVVEHGGNGSKASKKKGMYSEPSSSCLIPFARGNRRPEICHITKLNCCVIEDVIRSVVIRPMLHNILEWGCGAGFEIVTSLDRAYSRKRHIDAEAQIDAKRIILRYSSDNVRAESLVPEWIPAAGYF